MPAEPGGRTDYPSLKKGFCPLASDILILRGGPLTSVTPIVPLGSTPWGIAP